MATPEDAWKWSIGTPVLVTEDDGSIWETVTASFPWLIGNDWVICVKGIRGGYLLERVNAKV